MSKRKSKTKKYQNSSAPSSNTGSNQNGLTGAKKFFFAATLLSAAMFFGVGLFAILNRRNTVFTIVSFVGVFISLILTAIQTYPKLINHVRGSLRALFYLVISLIAFVALGFGWLVLQKPVIKIGVSLPFVGDDAQDAMPIFYAIKQAVDEEGGKINNYEIQLVPFDDTDINGKVSLMAPDTAGAVIKYEKKLADLTNDAQLAGIIGPFNSGTAEDEIPHTNPLHIPLISPAATEDCLTDSPSSKNFADAAGKCNGKNLGDGGTFFRTVSAENIRQTTLVANLAKSHSADATVAIFTNGSSFSDSLAARFADAWKTARPSDTKPEPHRLSGHAAQDIKDLGYVPATIVYAGTGSKGIDLHKAIQNNPAFAHTAFVAAATIMNGGFNQHLQGSIEGGEVYAITPMPYNEQSPDISRFISRYQSRPANLKPPTPYSASAYDATKILLASIRKATETTSAPVARWDVFGFGRGFEFRDKVLEKLRETNKNKGNDVSGLLTGPLQFTDRGDADFGNPDNEKNVSLYKFNKTSKEWEFVDWAAFGPN